MKHLKLNVPMLLLFIVLVFSGCNQIENSEETSESKTEDRQDMVFEKRELSEKLTSLDRRIDDKIDRIQSEVLKTEGSKQQELAAINEELIESQSIVKERLSFIKNRDEAEGWEYVREKTQVMIDTLNENVSKYEKNK